MKKVFLLFYLFYTAQSFAQGTWTPKADLPGAERIKAAATSIGNKAYVGTGQIRLSPYLKDFWEYDPTTNAWTRKTDLPANARTGAIAFSIGNKAYVGLGHDNTGAFKKDLWEYDPATNAWTRKADFAGTGRRFAVAFSIGNKGYVGTGDDGSGWVNDFWEYDPASNTWTQKSDFPGVGRKYAIGFVLNGKGYLGMGTGSGTVNDFYEYNPASDAWVQKTDFPGTRPEGMAAFALGDYGYVGTGDNWSSFGEKFWRYHPSTDTWSSITDFPGAGREHAVAFTVCGKGYICTGGQDIDFAFKDTWEYTPVDFVPGNDCCTPLIANFLASEPIACENACINFTDASLNNPTSWQWVFQGANTGSSTVMNPLNICYDAAGTYDVSLIVSNGNCSDTIVKPNHIRVIDTCGVIVVSDSFICSEGCVDFFAVVPSTASNFRWSFPGATPSSSTLRNPTSICYANNGNYDVMVVYSIGGVDDTITENNYVEVSNFACPDTVRIFLSDSTICEGECINFTPQSATLADTYQWQFPGGTPSVSNAQNPPDICYAHAGVYDVILIYSKGGVADTTIQTAAVIVNRAEIIATVSDSIVESGSVVQFNVHGATQFAWTSQTPLSCNDCSNPTALIDTTAFFFLEAVDSNGCPFTDTFLVSVDGACEHSVVIATAFSPNGDSRNEFIQPFLSAQEISGFKLSIFNRWGEMVFESINPQAKWDGTYKGVRQDVQVFVYMVQFSCLGKDYLKSGNITLVR